MCDGMINFEQKVMESRLKPVGSGCLTMANFNVREVIGRRKPGLKLAEMTDSPWFVTGIHNRRSPPVSILRTEMANISSRVAVPS